MPAIAVEYAPVAGDNPAAFPESAQDAGVVASGGGDQEAEAAPAVAAAPQEVPDISAWHPVDQKGNVVGADSVYTVTGDIVASIDHLEADGRENLVLGDYIISYRNALFAPSGFEGDGRQRTSTALAIIKAANPAKCKGMMFVFYHLRRHNLASSDDVVVSGLGEQDSANGSARPKLRLKTSSGIELKEGRDYELSYSDVTADGRAVVTATAKDDAGSILCTGFVSKSFSIADTSDISSAIVSEIADQPHTGSALTPKPTVRGAGRLLEEGTDYELSYENNVDVGMAAVTVTGKGAFHGSRTVRFSIVPAGGSAQGGADLSFADVGPVADMTYSGKQMRPPVPVALGGVKLTEGTDYQIEYGQNVNAGTAYAIVSGIGAYSGQRKTTFEILPADVNKANFPKLGTQAYAGGRAVEPDLRATFGGLSLKAGTDYAASYSGNKNMGRSVVHVRGIGNFTGTRELGFEIAKASIADATIGEIKPRYTNSRKKVCPPVTVKLAGKELVKGRDYKVSYHDNKNPGTATATVTGIGSYTGQKSVKFKLVNLGDDLAKTACKLSYSKGTWYQGGKFPGSAAYRKVYDKVGGNKGTHGRGCDASAGTIIRYSGYDRKMPCGLAGQRPYLGWNNIDHEPTGKGTSSRWAPICKYVKGMENKKNTKLRPGDIVFRNGHICIYVGKKIAVKTWKASLKGTDADRGKPTGKWVSGHFSHGGAAPGIGSGSGWAYPGTSSDQGWVFRCVKPKLKGHKHGAIVE